MVKFVDEVRKFISKGKIIDLAVGVAQTGRRGAGTEEKGMPVLFV